MDEVLNELARHLFERLLDPVVLICLLGGLILLILGVGKIASLRQPERGKTSPAISATAGIAYLGVGIVLGVAGVVRAASLIQGRFH